MDDRFPKYIRVLCQKLEFMAIPNWGMLICGLTVLAFVAKTAMGISMDRFIFDPILVLQGEWFRLFAFPGEVSSPIFFLFFLLYVYFVVGSLEAEWGPGPLTVFIVSSYVLVMAAGFLFLWPVSIWVYVITNITFAFSTLFPDVELSLFGIVPIKAKWLAILPVLFTVLPGLLGPLPQKGVTIIGLLPYLLFFGPMLVRNIKLKMRSSRNRQKFDEDMWR